jgi:predicted O-linked N-acetylglucosamine transferase (SPINDLY family)
MANRKQRRASGTITGSRHGGEPTPEEIGYLVSLFNLGRYTEAEVFARKITAIFPKFGFGWKVLGAVIKSQGRTEESLEAMRQAAALMPLDAQAHSNLGVTLKALGFLDEAAISYRTALKIKPDYVEAHSTLGKILMELGRPAEAEASLRSALAYKPDYYEAQCDLGSNLQDLGRMEEAEASFRRALALKPDFAMAHSNLLYLYAFTRIVSPQAELELAAEWEKTLLSEAERAAARDEIFKYPPRSGRKLRVGIVSAEIGQHAVAEFLEPLLAAFDRTPLHISLYPTIPRTGARAANIKALADEFKPLWELSDRDAALQIRADKIDVLIDTTSHMFGCRLGIFAHRAAPVQCHYIGYHGSTGLTEMDWFIADEELLPSSCDSHFREKIWRLPRLWIAYRGDTSLPTSNWQPDRDGTVWLGSFNNLSKVGTATLRLWAMTMNAIPQSKLLLKDNKATDRYVQQRILAELLTHGIAAERVEFVARVPDWAAHMALYDRLDIALDSVPLNSATTAFDALWMGVPMVAIEGDWMGGRMTSTILKALGKPEWVARDADEYVAKVTALAKDVEGRKALRAGQRALMAQSRLCDAQELSRLLEVAFAEMFDMVVTG